MEPLPDKLYRVGMLRIYVKEHLDRYSEFGYEEGKNDPTPFMERGEKIWEDLTHIAYDQTFYDRIGNLIKSYVPKDIRCFFHPYKLKAQQDVEYAQYTIVLLVSDCDKSNEIDHFKPYQIQDYFHRKTRYVLKERELWNNDLMMIEKGMKYRRNDDREVYTYQEYVQPNKTKTVNHTHGFREIDTNNVDKKKLKVIYEPRSSIKEVEICL